MNDDATSQLWLLASAYLDGELDAAERARAEADPAVMAAVGELRSLQSELRSVAPAPPQRRQAAIAAALAEFDALHEALDPDPVAGRFVAGRARHPRRARPTRWLGAVAAAVVVLGALGFVASSGRGGDDDDSAGLAEDAASDMESADVLAAPEAAGRAMSATDEATQEAAAQLTEATAADAGMDAPAAEAAVTIAPSATQLAAATTMADADLFSSADPIGDPGQLAAAAAQLLEQQRTGELVNTPETSCGTHDEARPLTVLAEGFYVIDAAAGATREVYLAVDEAAGQALALDRVDCTTIAAAPLP
jgi:hypothetical protein